MVFVLSRSEAQLGGITSRHWDFGNNNWHSFCLNLKHSGHDEFEMDVFFLNCHGEDSEQQIQELKTALEKKGFEPSSINIWDEEYRFFNPREPLRRSILKVPLGPHAPSSQHKTLDDLLIAMSEIFGEQWVRYHTPQIQSFVEQAQRDLSNDPNETAAFDM